MAAAAPLHAARGDGRAHHAGEPNRRQADRMRGMTTSCMRQTAASMALMPDARPRCRGQAPQPHSGAPKAQGLTAAIAAVAPSQAPSLALLALNSIGARAPIGTSTTLRIYTRLTDVTLLARHTVFPNNDRCMTETRATRPQSRTRRMKDQNLALPNAE